MKIIVNGRHLEITPALKRYSEEKIGKFEKYLSNITEAVVTLSVEKYRHKADVLLKVNGTKIQAQAVTEEVYSAIDEVFEKLEKQVIKHKEKIQAKRKGGKKAEAVALPSPSALETGRIIKHKKFDMKPMSPEEAVYHMDILDKDFLVFVNDRSGDMNVVYKRRDGNFGLIEPIK